VKELGQAIAVEDGESKLDEANLPEIEVMISVCAGLVTVDEESNIIRLVHYTAQEYFERTQTYWSLDRETYITKTCVTYLLFDAFNTGFCATDKEFKARLDENVLYNYAARNWGHHARAASIEAEQSILNFLRSNAKVSASSQALMAYESSGQRVPRKIIGVHLGAYFGLREAVIALLENGHEPDSKDTFARTPLSYAAENGHRAVVKLLLEKGAEVLSDGQLKGHMDNRGRMVLID
jgi:hypothetical protein